MPDRTSHLTAEGEEPTTDDTAQLLDLVLAHKLDNTRELLRERELHFSGTTAILRARLEEYLAQDSIAASDLVELLDRIEGWGNQHVYLFTSSDELAAKWSDPGWVEMHLEETGHGHLLNKHLPLVLPERPTLSSIHWSSGRVRLVWVEKRKWEERRPEEDATHNDLVLKAYRVRVERGVTSFDWDLVSRTAMLMVQRLPTGSDYTKKLDEYSNLMSQALSLDLFSRFEIRRAIRRIEQTGEVRLRQTNWETARGGHASLKSSGRETSYQDDPQLLGARQGLGSQVSGQLGNFYWLRRGPLRTEMHTHLYGIDNRIGIFGEHKEAEVRYVLSRIRMYS